MQCYDKTDKTLARAAKLTTCKPPGSGFVGFVGFVGVSDFRCVDGWIHNVLFSRRPTTGSKAENRAQYRTRPGPRVAATSSARSVGPEAHPCGSHSRADSRLMWTPIDGLRSLIINQTGNILV